MAKSKLPVAVGSNVTYGLGSMSSLSVGTTENKTATAAEAPLFVLNEIEDTVSAAKLAEKMIVKYPNGSVVEAGLFINGFAEVLADYFADEEAYTIQTPMGTVETSVAGSVEEPDAGYLTDENYPQLSLVAPVAWRKEAAKIEAYLPDSEKPCKITRVRDCESKSAELTVDESFYLEGVNLTYGGTGEKLELLENGTKIADVTVTSHSSKINFTCQIPSGTAIDEEKTHVLKLTTSAGTDKLWPCEIEVTLKEPPVVTPTIEAMFSPGYESEGKVAKNARTINIDGEGFSGLTKDDIAFELNGEALTLPQTAIWTINDDWIEIDNGTTAMFTGTDGDMIKVTLSKSGCTDVEFTTTLG